jgi:hypothetical protein
LVDAGVDEFIGFILLEEALGSWLLALGSWLLALGSWLLALGLRILSTID